MSEINTINLPPFITDWDEYDTYLNQKKINTPNAEKIKSIQTKPIVFIEGYSKPPELKSKPMGVSLNECYVPKFQLRKKL